VKHVLSSWFHFLAPWRCVLCGAPSGTQPFCLPCRAALPRIGDRCPRCALPTLNYAVCGACLQKPPPFQNTLTACRYAFPVDRIIQDFKYGKKLALAKPLALLLHDAYLAQYRSDSFTPPTTLIAMPLSRHRQIERGFNQAQEIARNLSRSLQIPLLNNVLLRIKDAPQQATLPWHKRHQNVRQTFSCTAPLAGKHVILVDDVMTSGATARAAAQALVKAGADQVDVWVIARTVTNDFDRKY
jgi:Predicted amidophosphoribosyltransferases